MRRAELLVLIVLLGALVPPAAAAPCTAEQIGRIEAALREAPLAADPMPEGAPGQAEERRCTRPQADAIRSVLRACQPAAEQVVVYLGAGKCLEQAGYRIEAKALYLTYLERGDRSVSEARAAERRQRVRRWLEQMGERAPGGATLIIASDLRGALLGNLDGYPDGVIIGAGETRLSQPPGSRRLSLSIKGFRRVELPVDLIDESESRVEVSWREHLSPRYLFLRDRWDDFKRSGLTPAGYLERRRRPLALVLSLLLATGGAALIGFCAANVGGTTCDEGWKQGVAYAVGTLLGVSGLISGISSIATPLERLPEPVSPPR